ncbi:MAG TPA: hypothetical protein VIH90_06500 [Candidatus Saccharimonadales bacterium]
MFTRRWTDEQLEEAVKVSYSYRNVIKLLGLIPAGGNYKQVQERIAKLGLGTAHFKGRGWNTGLLFNPNPAKPLVELLVLGSRPQSYLLKKRLYAAGLKIPKCELCGWHEKSIDGRIPVELDHKNGDHYDNRIENLRILCPNCHSLQVTHRGKNKGVNKYARVS